jgi:membrane fusion protein (multidrug efflux system)
MSKRIKYIIVIMSFLLLGVFGFNLFKGYMIGQFMKGMISKPISVSTERVQKKLFQKKINMVGTLRPLKSIQVTSEAAGMIESIHFTSGQQVKEGDVLVALNIDPDIAQLESIKATCELNRITLMRDEAQFKIKGVSQATLDADEANYKACTSQISQYEALINQKIIKAPFNGSLGLSLINEGQYVTPGTSIVDLSSFEPMFIRFSMPQDIIIKVGTPLVVSKDNETRQAIVSSITSTVDPDTRTYSVEAIVDNQDSLFKAGMYGEVEVPIGKQEMHYMIPQTAITFNPFGALVYVVSKDHNTASQSFVQTGETQEGDIVILKGLKEDDEVVTAGQMKLRNGSAIKIDNSIQPKNPATIIDE